jgi:Tol biopolymer transport system component
MNPHPNLLRLKSHRFQLWLAYGGLFGLMLVGVSSLLQLQRARFPINQYIVFESDRSGTVDLYITRVDGEATYPLVQHPQWDSHPVWSGDGRWIVFESARQNGWDIYIIDPMGRDLRRLTRSFNIERFPEWAKDGTILYKRNQASMTFQTLRMDIRGQHLPLAGHEIELYRTFSPDGQAYILEVIEHYQYRLYLVTDEGRYLLTHHLLSDRMAAWSPDGQWLAFSSNRDRNWEIYILSQDGTTGHRLTHHPADDLRPSWSPKIDKPWSFLALAGSGLGLSGLWLVGKPLVKKLATFTTQGYSQV